MQKKESRFKKLSHTIYECKYHIHLVVSIPPAYSVSNFMGCLKGKLSLRLFSQYEKLGK
ncbi:MAG: transposase, partial [bacterium]